MPAPVIGRLGSAPPIAAGLGGGAAVAPLTGDAALSQAAQRIVSVGYLGISFYTEELENMSFLYNSRITSLAWKSGAGDPSPALDDKPANVATAPQATDTLVATLGGHGSALFLANVTAASVDVAVLDTADNIMAVIPQIQLYDASGVGGDWDEPRQDHHCWIDYPYQSGAHKLEITLTGVSGAGNPSVGIVRAGHPVRLKNPSWSLSLEYRDGSRIAALSTGGEEVLVDGEVYRVWSGKVGGAEAKLDAARLLAVKRAVRSRPFGVLVVGGLDNRLHAAWARFEESSVTIAAPTVDVVRFRIREVV